MDSMEKSLRQSFKQLEQAKVDVRPIVGDVIGMDSAEQVYRFALDQMSIDHKDMPSPGLRTMFNALKERRAAPKPTLEMAQDSATTVKTFNLDRFGRA